MVLIQNKFEASMEIFCVSLRSQLFPIIDRLYRSNVSLSECASRGKNFAVLMKIILRSMTRNNFGGKFLYTHVTDANIMMNAVLDDFLFRFTVHPTTFARILRPIFSLF